MSWTYENTYWRRPLDCHDKLFQSIAAAGAPLGREHWLMAGWFQLSFPSTVDVELRLRNAWGALRLRHPDVALTLHENEKRYEPLFDNQALLQWTNETFCVETDVSSIDELFPQHLRIAPPHATCHWVPTSREIAIVSPHWRWDGRGHMMVLHNFMDLLAGELVSPSMQVVAGTEAVNLAPTLDTVIGVPDVPKEEWLRKADDMLAPFLDGSPAIGLPITPALPQNTMRVEMVFSKTISTTLRETCRARRIGFTAALHASVVLETARYSNKEGDAEDKPVAKYKSWAPFDLRKHCPPPPHSTAHAPSIRMLGMPFFADPTASWDTLASTFQTYYTQPMAPSVSDMMFVRVPYVEKATAMLEKAPPTTEANLSNLGVMEDYLKKRYGEFKVGKVTFAVEMLSPQLCVHVWSWDGEIRISVCYNEAFYQEQFVRTWLDGLRMNLLNNLDVEIPNDRLTPYYLDSR